MDYTPSQIIRRAHPGHEWPPEDQTPGPELEADALRRFAGRSGPAGRSGRAIRAIFCARRRARTRIFYVTPWIADGYGLSIPNLHRVLGKLDGQLIEARIWERGKYRDMQLLPDWENLEALAGDPVLRYQKTLTETVLADGGFNLEGENMPSRIADHMLSPEVLAALQRRLDKRSPS